ncbi:MAG: hypothetical protein HRU03_04905 [Nanoarchaeales archaeon]|nr:hypothetical protein [Nanoarchaeales archaeon]
MNTTFQKKGAVEMSLNLIIMLVIGLTLMGLVIGFVTSFLGEAEGKFAGSLTEDDQVKIDQVKRESGNFAFSSSSLSLIQGASSPTKLYVKVRNPHLNKFDFMGGELADSGDISYTVSEGRVDAQGGVFKIFSPPMSLESGTSEGYSLEVYADDTPLGTYYITFTMAHTNGVSTETKVLTFTVE